MKIGNIVLKNPFILGPMAGITDSSFRRICKSFGCSLAFSEMISSKGLYYKDEKTEQLIKFTEEEKPVGFQIFGSDPEIMAFAARKLSERENDIIDINMGCPVPKVVKNGDGAALLKNPVLVGKIVQAVVKNAGKPVTVKIRLGWDAGCINVIKIAKIIEDSGAVAVTVHCRTRDQYYAGRADWDYLEKIKAAVKIPVIGSGDVFTGKDAVCMLEKTGCDGVMIARGARGNPWIFQEARVEAGLTCRAANPSIDERVQVMIEHLLSLVEEKGEYVAVRQMRKHIGWYLKGFRHSVEIKRHMNELESKEEIITLLNRYRDEFCKC